MRKYFEEKAKVEEKLDEERIWYLIDRIREADTVWLCGNGGSATTAEHMAVDLIKLAHKRAVAISSLSLCSMSVNDYLETDMFRYGLQRLVHKNDLVICLSCSGTSLNIESVLEDGVLCCRTFLITGRGVMKGKVSEHVDKLVIESEDYQILEDIMLSICHVVCRTMGGVR